MSVATEKTKHTPLMEQYHEIRAAYPDTLLLFQVGDFYELFFEDAQRAALFLGITLTSRGKSESGSIPLCGFPVHTKDHYIAKLVKGGFNVALCDQLEPPRPGVLVKRGVTQVFTPGTLLDSQLLDAKSASYLFSFFPLADQWGLLFGELLTAQLYATVIKAGDNRLLDAQLSRFLPDEILIPHGPVADTYRQFFSKAGYLVTPLDLCVDLQANHNGGMRHAMDQWVGRQFEKALVDTIEKQESLQMALYYFYFYVQRNQPNALDQFKSINFYSVDDFLLLDQATQRNLEIIKDTNGSAKNSLFTCIDTAKTAMGSRMIKKWLLRPLVKAKPIEQRFEAIEVCMQQLIFMQQLAHLLARLGDVERVIGRIALRKASVSDYLVLKNALALIPEIKIILYPHTKAILFALIYEHLSDFSALNHLLASALNDDFSKDCIIKSGFNYRLDQVRELVATGHQKVSEMERYEQEATGINSLKIRYNQLYGYYIEVTKTHSNDIPAHYVRQQTLVGRERYMTGDLQALQQDIVGAHTDIQLIEKELFDAVKIEITTHIHSLRKCAHALAHLDALLSFSYNAYLYNYVRPIIDGQSSSSIDIRDGRHPVVERGSLQAFIANDTCMDDNRRLWVITGPNMGGKSTYLRQIALIHILAQAGSFVPASYARIGLVDRIFTRIGAGDNVAGGKSTFLVEMEETAVICRDATAKSLVILDEVGRGTSTFDGLAIAQALVEYMVDSVKARCFFATHYHELALLEKSISAVASYYAMSKKTPLGIVFLYKIAAGIADGSFGIEVAKLAELPESIISRAKVLLHDLTIQEEKKRETYSGLYWGGVSQDHSTGYYSEQTVGHTAKNKDRKLGSTVGLAVGHGTGNNVENSVLYQENVILQQEIIRLNLLLQKYNTIIDIDFDQLTPKKAFDIVWDLNNK